MPVKAIEGKVGIQASNSNPRGPSLRLTMPCASPTKKKPESTWKERPAAKDMELHNWVAFPSTSSTLQQRSRPVRQMPLALSSAVSPACLAQHSEVDGKTGRGGRRVPACLCLSMLLPSQQPARTAFHKSTASQWSGLGCSGPFPRYTYLYPTFRWLSIRSFHFDNCIPFPSLIAVGEAIDSCC